MVTVRARAEAPLGAHSAGLAPQVPKGKDTMRSAGVRGNREEAHPAPQSPVSSAAPGTQRALR